MVAARQRLVHHRSPSAVDVGFAQDMSTHHTQAVTMAGYERDTTSNSALRVLATDIETSQQFQIGEMQGWLDGWNKPRNNSGPQMAWMNHSIPVGQLMPGMATEAQMRSCRAARQGPRHPVPAADDPSPPGRDLDGQVRARPRQDGLRGSARGGHVHAAERRDHDHGKSLARWVVRPCHRRTTECRC